MANAAATAAIGGMINGVPGSVPVGIPGMGTAPNGMPMSIPGVGEPANLAQAVASAAAVAAVSQPKAEHTKPPTPVKPEEASQALDQSVEV